jgi:hypothetical protein
LNSRAALISVSSKKRTIREIGVLLHRTKARPVADYRTDPSDRGIIGHSYGGDFVLYALFHAPELFSRYIAGSPNFNSAAAFEGQPTLSAKVLVSIGERDEASSSEKLLADFVETLENYEGLELTTMIFPGATHFASRPLHHVSGVYSIYGLRQ